MRFFRFMARRYEHAPSVRTSNKDFKGQGDIFGDEAMAAALIYRLANHCHLMTIRGNRYRMRQHTDLWQALDPNRDADPATNTPGRRRRIETRPVAEPSDIGPALICSPLVVPLSNRRNPTSTEAPFFRILTFWSAI
jgi:hypothetical protein